MSAAAAPSIVRRRSPTCCEGRRLAEPGFTQGWVEAAAQALDALLTRRRQLLDMLGAERHRLGEVFGKGRRPVRKSL